MSDEARDLRRDMATTCDDRQSPQATPGCLPASHEKREERMDSFELEAVVDNSVPTHASQQTSLACVMSAALSSRRNASDHALVRQCGP